MYEYAPKSEKKTEKLLLGGSLAVGILLWIASQLPNVPFPAVLQLFGVACFAFDIIVVSKYLICRYVYRVEVSPHDGLRELVVIEYCGKRIRTVCRIPVSAVLSAERVTDQNRKDFAKQHRNKTVYRYTGELRPECMLWLDVTYGGEQFGLCLLFDEGLKNAIATC